MPIASLPIVRLLGQLLPAFPRKRVARWRNPCAYHRLPAQHGKISGAAATSGDTLLLVVQDLGDRIDDAQRATYSRRGDRFWLVGYTLLFLDPSLILFSIGLLAVGSVWFALWLVYLLFVIRYFPRVQTARKSS